MNVCEGNQIQREHLPAYILEHTPGHLEVDPAENGPVLQPIVHEHNHSGTSWADAERKMIMDAMVKAQGRKSEAAEILGYCRSTLWRKNEEARIIE